jgi:hypothetical protein
LLASRMEELGERLAVDVMLHFHLVVRVVPHLVLRSVVQRASQAGRTTRGPLGSDRRLDQHGRPAARSARKDCERICERNVAEQPG